MEVDFKLIESLKRRGDIKPRILHIIINSEKSPQIIKEIIILDEYFQFWLDKTEIEVFLDKEDEIEGFRVKVLDGKKLVWTKYRKITEISEIENSSVEHSISVIVSSLFGLKKEINRRVIYVFNDINIEGIGIDKTISQKINEGILTTEATINALIKKL